MIFRSSDPFVSSFKETFSSGSWRFIMKNFEELTHLGLDTIFWTPSSSVFNTKGGLKKY